MFQASIFYRNFIDTRHGPRQKPLSMLDQIRRDGAIERNAAATGRYIRARLGRVKLAEFRAEACAYASKLDAEERVDSGFEAGNSHAIAFSEERVIVYNIKCAIPGMPLAMTLGVEDALVGGWL
jgi:hypothetical protein